MKIYIYQGNVYSFSKSFPENKKFIRFKSKLIKQKKKQKTKKTPKAHEHLHKKKYLNIHNIMNLCHSVKNGQHHWTEIRSSSEIKNKSQELRK